MADEHQWQSSDEPESPIVELEQERSGWLLPVFIVLLLLLGSGYLLSSFLEESPKLPEVSVGTPLAMKQPAASTVSESVPVIVSEPVPDEKETSVEEALVEDVVIVDEVEPASSITREGDLVTITVYEEVQAEVIAELEQSEGGMTDKAQHQASVVVAQEDTAADIVEPVEEGLNVVWSTHRQAQVDLASEGGQQLKSVNEAKQAVQLEPVPLRPVLTIEEIVHVVVKGDTLWDIAERYIHDPFRYPELARLSQIQNPDLIYPGDRVRIRIIRHAEGNGGQ
jgi:LysM repeat protein